MNQVYYNEMTNYIEDEVLYLVENTDEERRMVNRYLVQYTTHLCKKLCNRKKELTKSTKLLFTVILFKKIIQDVFKNIFDVDDIYSSHNVKLALDRYEIICPYLDELLDISPLLGEDDYYITCNECTNSSVLREHKHICLYHKNHLELEQHLLLLL